MAEETAIEVGEPFLENIDGISRAESPLGQHKNLRWTEAVAKSVVDEEIMEFIGSYQIFCLLGYFSIGHRRSGCGSCLGGQQLGADRRVHDVQQDVRCWRMGILMRHPRDEVTHEGLWNAGVDTIHFGLVCIVNIMIGGITPPFGSMMFTTCGITGCRVGDFIKEVWPFILCLFIVLLLITFIPVLVTVVPNLIYGPINGSISM